MVQSSGVAPKRESRPALTERLPMICQLGGDNQDDNIPTLRRQRLAAFGLSKVRSDLVASLAWGTLQ